MLAESKIRLESNLILLRSTKFLFRIKKFSGWWIKFRITSSRTFRACQIGLNERKQEAHERELRWRRVFALFVLHKFSPKTCSITFFAIKNLLPIRAHLCLFSDSRTSNIYFQPQMVTDLFQFIWHWNDFLARIWIEKNNEKLKSCVVIFLFFLTLLQIFSLVVKQLKVKKVQLSLSMEGSERSA